MTHEEYKRTVDHLEHERTYGFFSVNRIGCREILLYDDGKRAWTHVLSAYNTPHARKELLLIIPNYIMIG